MAHKTLIGGTAYEISGGKTLIGGTAYKIDKGKTLVGGTAYGVVFYTPTPLGNRAVGDSVFLNVNGVSTEFIVVHKGLPSSIYDSSCNGIWLLMKDCYESRNWHTSEVSDYANSDIHAYLNSGFLSLFDADVKSSIKQAKIPYWKGAGKDGSASSGANGLSAKVFLLSGYEVGFTQAINSSIPVDSAKLDYFEEGSASGSTARAKRIAYLNGAAADWWLRSPSTLVNTYAIFVRNTGHYNGGGCKMSKGIRPALILPSNFLV